MNALKPLWNFAIIAMFCQFVCNASQTLDTLSIEITSGSVKIPAFFITGNDSKLCKKIAKLLEKTKRLRCADSVVDLQITITRGVNKITVKIYDTFQNKCLNEFTLNYNSISEEKLAAVIADKIYESWFNEPGICDTRIYYIMSAGANVFAVGCVNFFDNDVTITGLISYLCDIYYYENAIYLTKFDLHTRGFGIFRYDLNLKKYYIVLLVKGCSVSCPFVKDRLYFSLSRYGTTGVYSLPHGYSWRFKDYNHCVSTAQKIEIIPRKIVTQFSIDHNSTAVFCTNENGKPSIIKYDHGVRAIISGRASYYSPTQFGRKIAAIKIHEGMFHLVVIDSHTHDEKVILSKYYISRPCWSPCGNWIAVSARDRGGQEHIFLIHKYGKIIELTGNSHDMRNPVWVKGA